MPWNSRSPTIWTSSWHAITRGWRTPISCSPNRGVLDGEPLEQRLVFPTPRFLPFLSTRLSLELFCSTTNQYPLIIRLFRAREPQRFPDCKHTPRNIISVSHRDFHPAPTL